MTVDLMLISVNFHDELAQGGDKDSRQLYKLVSSFIKNQKVEDIETKTFILADLFSQTKKVRLGTCLRRGE